MFFGTGNPTFGFILKPEVELVVFLRMGSNKITKNCESVLEMQFEGLVSRVYVFRHNESELEVHFEKEVELMVFLRMRSKKSRKTTEKCP